MREIGSLVSKISEKITEDTGADKRFLYKKAMDFHISF